MDQSTISLATHVSQYAQSLKSTTRQQKNVIKRELIVNAPSKHLFGIALSKLAKPVLQLLQFIKSISILVSHVPPTLPGTQILNNVSQVVLQTTFTTYPPKLVYLKSFATHQNQF